MFQPLKLTDIKKVVALELNKLASQAKTNKLSIKADTKLIKLIAEQSYTPQEGARSIKRKLQELVMSPLADKLLAGEIEKGASVKISAEEGKVVFN